MVRGVRRETVWIGISPAATTITAAGGTLIYVLNAAALALRPFTVVRTHMAFMLRSDQAAAIEQQIAAFSWAVVSDQASAIGVTAVPTGFTDISSDLFFLHKIMYAACWKDSTAGFAAKRGEVFESDSKAMRRVNDDQDVVGVGEIDTASGSDGAVLLTAGRMLLKLH